MEVRGTVGHLLSLDPADARAHSEETEVTDTEKLILEALQYLLRRETLGGEGVRILEEIERLLRAAKRQQ